MVAVRFGYFASDHPAQDQWCHYQAHGKFRSNSKWFDLHRIRQCPGTFSKPHRSGKSRLRNHHVKWVTNPPKTEPNLQGSLRNARFQSRTALPSYRRSPSVPPLRRRRIHICHNPRNIRQEANREPSHQLQNQQIRPADRTMLRLPRATRLHHRARQENRNGGQRRRTNGAIENHEHQMFGEGV